MKHNFNRVIETQEIQTVPDFVALSKALQADMLEAAQHIRNALYDNPHMETLAIALIALDFAHFIPIENSVEGLMEEWDRLWEELMDASLADSIDRIGMQFDDLYKELNRRVAWGEPVKNGLVCKDCDGSGFDDLDGTSCSRCGGTGIDEGSDYA